VRVCVYVFGRVRVYAGATLTGMCIKPLISSSSITRKAFTIIVMYIFISFYCYNDQTVEKVLITRKSLIVVNDCNSCLLQQSLFHVYMYLYVHVYVRVCVCVCVCVRSKIFIGLVRCIVISLHCNNDQITIKKC